MNPAVVERRNHERFEKTSTDVAELRAFIEDKITTLEERLIAQEKLLGDLSTTVKALMPQAMTRNAVLPNSAQKAREDKTNAAS